MTSASGRPAHPITSRMVYRFLAAPFADAARAGQFEALHAALQAGAAPDTLLLGNLVLEDGAAPLDAVVVRPHSISLCVLVPGGGPLSIPALSYGCWHLDGGPLPVADEYDNPYEQFLLQKAALAAWLRPRFSPGQVNLDCITGLVVFAAPVAFGAEVELALSDAPAGFQLLSTPTDLPRRLPQLATAEINLSQAELAEWAAEWAAFTAPAPDAAATRPEPAPGAAGLAEAAGQEEHAGFWGGKARALWGWLGAHDVPDDPAYGYNTVAVAARSEEKEQLEHLRQQMQADLQTQLQALETREAERERSIAQLRAELAQAPPVAAEATALVSRLGAETREKAALEAEMEASRAESAARHRELDTKIQQLSQLIEKLSAVPATSPAIAAAPAPAPVDLPSVSAKTPQPATAAAVPPAVTAEIPQPAAAASFDASSVAAAPVAQPAWAAWLARAGQHARTAGSRARPVLQKLGAQVRRQPRVAAAVAGVAVLSLWGLSRAGSSAPVPFQENNRWGYADASGKPVVPARYAAAGPFQEGRAVVKKDGAYGFLDEKGRETVTPAYDALNPYAGGYARARVGEAYTFVDEDGQEFDHYYFNALDFAEGQAAVLDHRGWHYISGPEEVEKPAIFLEAYSFADGLARVKLRDGYTYITADYLDDPTRGTKPFGYYQLASDFAEGRARVKQDGRSFTINKDGEEVK